MKTYTVVNRKGFNLPTTGGFGTLLFSGIVQPEKEEQACVSRTILKPKAK